MRRKALLIVIGMLLLAPLADAKPPVFANPDGAIRGFDAVAYFTEGKPVKGDKQHSVEWNGATWYFASAASRGQFQADPARYAPRYRGYCAYAVANGYTASTDPDAWSIVDGKLYLNYSLGVRDLLCRQIGPEIDHPPALGGCTDGRHERPELVRLTCRSSNHDRRSAVTRPLAGLPLLVPRRRLNWVPALAAHLRSAPRVDPSRLS